MSDHTDHRRGSGGTLRLYLAAFAAFIAAALVTLLVLESFHSEQHDFAELINRSGRQRMLSQQIALYAEELVAASGNDLQKKQARARMLANLGLFVAQHHQLRAGVMLDGHKFPLSETLAHFYLSNGGGVEPLVQLFIHEARAVLANDLPTAPSDSERVNSLNRLATGPLLSALDQVVLELQHESEESTDRLRTKERVGFAVLILFMFGELVLVLGPRSSRALHHSESIVETIVANTDAILFAIDRHGRILFSDGKGLAPLGLSPGQRVGESVYQIYRDNPVMLEALAKALQGEKSSALTMINGIWQEMHFDPAFDAKGVPDGLRGVSINVHDRMLSERKLADTQDRLKAVLSHVPFSFWAVGADRKFLYREGTGIQSLGLSANTIVGRAVDEIFHAYPDVIKAMDRALAGEAVELKTEIGARWYNVVFAPTRDDGEQICGVTGITFDISDRKHIEDERNDLQVRERAAQEASRLKSEFLATMSHELRTPINGVVGMTSLLLDSTLSTTQRDHADSIRLSAAALLAVVNDILDFSKIEAGRLDFEATPFSLKHLLDEIAKTFTHLAVQKGLKFSVTEQLGDQCYFRGDPGRIRQVVANLLSNAIKFTSDGSIWLNVCLGTDGTDDNMLKFSVRDTGIGIPEQVKEKLFKAFTQADASTARKFGGTGLGLSICKSLVQAMGGQIEVTSRAGEGSTFAFAIVLPRVTATALAPKPVVPTHQVSEDHIGKRILLAEDNLINQKIALAMLAKMGYRASAVANGKEALHALNTSKYDLVLMDCQMPEMDGYEATTRIRGSANAQLAQLPIVAMTANAFSSDRDRCLAVGMDDFVAKPVGSSELASVIARWLNKNQGASAA